MFLKNFIRGLIWQQLKQKIFQDYPQEILENLDGSVQNLDLELTRLKQDIDGAEARMKNAINISEAATWPGTFKLTEMQQTFCNKSKMCTLLALPATWAAHGTRKCFR